MTNFNVTAGEAKTRSAYLDNLRSWVMFLVVAMHSNVTYSGIGGWYYTETATASLDPVSLLLFAFYGSFTQAWFMGVLFFLAAVFAARSLAKRGPASFAKERLFRLGVPLLLYVFVVTPFIGYFLMDHESVRERYGFLEAYGRYLMSFDWLGSTGPLWFAEALLGFCLLYALWRSFRPLAATASAQGRSAPLIHSPRGYVLAILGTGLAAFSVRLFFPIGTEVLNLQFAFFASYIVLFILGLKAGEGDWLEALAERNGMRWFAAVLAAGIPLWFVLMITGGAMGGAIPIEGGLHWQSFAYAFWEAFVAIGFSIGMVAFFKKHINAENAFTRFLAANSFGIYLFHAPILIAVSLALRNWGAVPLLKHAVVLPLAYSASLAFSALVRRVPLLREAVK